MRACAYTLYSDKTITIKMSLVAWYDFVMEIGIPIYVHFSFTFLLNGSLIALFWAV